MRRIPARTFLLLAVSAAAVAGAVTAGIWVWQAYYVGKFGVVVSGTLYRCRQPRNRQWSVLDRYVIQTVINLRAGSDDPLAFEEERRRTSEAGARLVHIPVVTELPTYEQFELFIREVRTGPGPTLVHCEHGRNRTGFMSAAYLIVMEGWTVDRAMADLESYGPNLDNKKDRRAALVKMLARLHGRREQWRRRTDPALAALPAPSTGPSR